MEERKAYYTIERASSHIHVEFASPCRVLSSAPLNGGFVNAARIVNINVGKNAGGRERTFEPSEVALAKFCGRMGWDGEAVGMMTAASMDTFRQASRREQGVEATALVTAGVSNARRAGDPAECREMGDPVSLRGTINIILLTNARLTEAAMVEAVITVTEAKAAALQDLGVPSGVTGDPATGTGTDAVAIANGLGPPLIRYCGKHVLFGEMLACTVIRAIKESLEGRLKFDV